jgi:hypothetical protein
MKLEGMGSTITEDKFLTHVLNNLTGDFGLMILLEKRIGSKENQIKFDEMIKELIPYFRC